MHRILITVALISTIGLIAASAEDYITQCLTITEERFTGVWARESVCGRITDILWFNEPGKFIAFHMHSRITRSELLQVMAFFEGYFRGETMERPRNLQDMGSFTHEDLKYNIRVETIGECFIWSASRWQFSPRITGPHKYRFEGNMLYFSWGGTISWVSNPERPFTEVALDSTAYRMGDSLSTKEN